MNIMYEAAENKDDKHVQRLIQTLTWFPAQLGRLQKYTWNF